MPPRKKSDLTPVTMAMADLLLDPVNARIHGPRNIDAIRASLRQFGQRRAIIVDRNNVIVAGNGTFTAAQAEGMDHIEVVVFPGTPAEARAYAIADNRTADLAEWDYAILLEQVNAIEPHLLDAIGFDPDELANIEKLNRVSFLAGDGDPDDFDPEPPAMVVSKVSDLWLLGPHRVVCGDAGLHDPYVALLGDEKADMVWTDPPYGVAYVGKTRNRLVIENDALDSDDLHSFLLGVIQRAKSASRPGAVWQVTAPPGPLQAITMDCLAGEGVLRGTIIWVKDQFVMGHSDYHYRHEPIFYGWTPGAKHHATGDRTQDSVWEIARPRRSAEHPTMKPVELVARAIGNHTDNGELILDPFGGSGTTLIAANDLGRKAALIELDPRYVDVICRRYQEHTGDVPILAATKEPHDFT